MFEYGRRMAVGSPVWRDNGLGRWEFVCSDVETDETIVLAAAMGESWEIAGTRFKGRAGSIGGAKRAVEDKLRELGLPSAEAS